MNVISYSVFTLIRKPRLSPYKCEPRTVKFYDSTSVELRIKETHISLIYIKFQTHYWTGDGPPLIKLESRGPPSPHVTNQTGQHFRSAQS